MSTPDLWLVYLASQYNRNSIAALVGALERHPDITGVRQCFVADGAEAAEHLRGIIARGERMLMALSLCTPQRLWTTRAVRQVRQVAGADDGQLTILAGGPHPSGAPQDMLELGCDWVLVGEGEEVFPEIVRRWAARMPVADVPGMACRYGDQVSINGRAAHIDELDDYPPFSLRHRRIGNIEITRGCPYGCRFCQTTYLQGARPRHRSAEVVADWVARARSLGVPFVRFVTPNALSYGSASGRSTNLAALEDLLVRLGHVIDRDKLYLGSFPSEVRPEMVTDEAISLLTRLTGNTHLAIGAQSGSDRVLRSVHRGHTAADVYHACEVILRHGLVPNVDFIFGLPGEGDADRRLTLKMIRDLAAAGAHIRSHAFVPLPGTPLEGERAGVIDARTDRVLGRLASRGQQHGSRRVSDAARETAAV